MPWSTPTLKQVRENTRDFVAGALANVKGGDKVKAALNRTATVGNSVLRVMSDAMSGLAHLTLRYVDWALKQMLPDSAEKEFLDRHGEIWLKNADGSKGRKNATFATGSITVTGINGTPLPFGSRFRGDNGFEYETVEEIVVFDIGTSVKVRALDSGSDGNLDPDITLSLSEAISGIDGSAVVVELRGGTNDEDDETLRARVLDRIQQPPMGGAYNDYIQWAEAFPGVTRAWVFPQEMGIGTCTVRFMMDDLRADNNGFPTSDDVSAVAGWMDTKRPVTVKDFWCLAPLPSAVNYTIANLVTNNAAVKASIEKNVRKMFRDRAVPGGTIYRSWFVEAVSKALGEDHHDTETSNFTAPDNGHLPVLGTITYV